MPDNDLAVSLMVHFARYAGYKIDKQAHDAILNKNLLLAAWTQILFGVFIFAGVIYFIYRYRLKRKKNSL